MRKIKLKIEGMHCVSCAMLIDGDLEDLDGVKRANTSYAKGEAEIEFDEAKVELSDFKESIEKSGYKVNTHN